MKTELDKTSSFSEESVPQKIKNLKKKNFWRKIEDSRLRMLVKRLGTKKWKLVSKFMSDRSEKQCRERWYYYLDPKIKKFEWTDKDDWILFLGWKLHGNKWKKISEYFIEELNSRKIRNRFKSFIKKNQKGFDKKIENAFNLFNKNYEEYENTFSEIEKAILKEIFKSFENNWVSNYSLQSKKNLENFNKIKHFSKNTFDFYHRKQLFYRPVQKLLQNSTINDIMNDFNENNRISLNNYCDFENWENILEKNYLNLGGLKQLDKLLKGYLRDNLENKQIDNFSFMNEKEIPNFETNHNYIIITPPNGLSKIKDSDSKHSVKSYSKEKKKKIFKKGKELSTKNKEKDF